MYKERKIAYSVCRVNSVLLGSVFGILVMMEVIEAKLVIIH